MTIGEHGERYFAPLTLNHDTFFGHAYQIHIYIYTQYIYHIYIYILSYIYEAYILFHPLLVLTPKNKNALTSLPASGQAVDCSFLLMTVGCKGFSCSSS